MDASVIVATRNRSGFLAALLDALAKQQVPEGVVWELLIVDNGSGDATPQVLAHELSIGRLPLTPLCEPIPGKSRALNLAMGRARGDLWIFTDDDVLPEPAWLAAYIDAAQRHPAVQGFAGRVLPKWLGPLPPWLHTEGPFAVPRGITNTRDFGTDESPLPREVIPGGVNTALRSAAARQAGLFRVDLGPGTSVPYAEDTEYMKRVIEACGPFLYVPGAMLHHCNVPERMTKAYVLRWLREAARSQVLSSSSPALNSAAIHGVPRYLLRQVSQRFVSWALEPRPLPRFRRAMHLHTSIGQIRGHLERAARERSR